MKLLNCNTYSDAIIEHFEMVYTNYKHQFPSFEKFLEEHLFFITVSFDCRKASGSGPKANAQLNEFRNLHFKIAQFVHGNKLNRKRKSQTLTYAFVDFEGSRQGRSDLFHSQLPHVHALALVKPEHLPEFRSATLMPRLKLLVPSIKTIEIEIIVRVMERSRIWFHIA